MGALHICLFGEVRVMHEGLPCEFKATRIVRSLMAYLMLQTHRNYSREVLAGTFWRDYNEERARNCLSTALWRLRRLMEPRGVARGTYLVTTSTGEIGFNWESEYRLDTEICEQTLDLILVQPVQTMGAEEAKQLEDALCLYTGDLLDGIYDDWVFGERERFRCLYLDGLKHLMGYYQYRNMYDQGLKCGQQILRHDPLREEIHREVMRMYWNSGQRAMAAQQYRVCQEILKKELGISPMEETRDLYEKVAECHPTQDLSNSPSRIQDVLNQLRLDLQGFDHANRRLQQSIRRFEHLTGLTSGQIPRDS